MKSHLGRLFGVLVSTTLGAGALVGCGSASVTTSMGATTSTMDPSAVDRGLVGGINVTLADLPQGWSMATPASTLVLDKADCGLAPTDSVVLNSATYASAGSAEQARSEAGTAPASTVAADEALFSGAQGENCAMRFIEQLNTVPVTITDVSRLAAISTEADGPTSMTGFRMSVRPAASASATPATVDAILIFAGRFEVVIVFTGTAGGVAEATETSAIRSVNQRLAQAANG